MPAGHIGIGDRAVDVFALVEIIDCDLAPGVRRVVVGVDETSVLDCRGVEQNARVARRPLRQIKREDQVAVEVRFARVGVGDGVVNDRRLLVDADGNAVPAVVSDGGIFRVRILRDRGSARGRQDRALAVVPVAGGEPADDRAVAGVGVGGQFDVDEVGTVADRDIETRARQGRQRFVIEVKALCLIPKAISISPRFWMRLPKLFIPRRFLKF